MNLAEVLRHLDAGCHVYSKNYHDGHGRKYWLTDVDHREICELKPIMFARIQKARKLKSERVISSDEAVLYEVET